MTNPQVDWHFIVDWSIVGGFECVYIAACGYSGDGYATPMHGNSTVSALHERSDDLCQDCLNTEAYKHAVTTFEIGCDGNPNLERKMILERFDVRKKEGDKK